MTTVAADVFQKYGVNAATRDVLVLKLTATIGASGAVTSTDYVDDPALTITKGATGVYSFTLPKCVDVSVLVELVSTSAPKIPVVSAKAATSGTASVTFYDAATPSAAYPASGDVVTFYFVCETRSRLQ